MYYTLHRRCGGAAHGPKRCGGSAHGPKRCGGAAHGPKRCGGAAHGPKTSVLDERTGWATGMSSSWNNSQGHREPLEYDSEYLVMNVREDSPNYLMLIKWGTNRNNAVQRLPQPLFDVRDQ